MLALCPRMRKIVPLLSCLALLGFAASVYGDPKPLTKEEQAKVDEAIDKGVAFLKKEQKKDGSWPRYWPSLYPIAQIALPAYALLESGVPADDPGIQKAAELLRKIALKTPTNLTYELSLTLLFFDRLGDPKDKKLIQSLALRLILGQGQTGAWSYRNVSISEKHEAALLKLLGELGKRMEAGKSSVEALSEIEVPLLFRHVTVFQDLRAIDWREEKAATDNSNTQFAIMGLWAAQRHDVPTTPTLRLVVERFERTQAEDGRWAYRGTGSTALATLTRRSMTCVGLIALAVGRGTKMSTPGAPAPGQVDLRVLRGLAALYQGIGLSTRKFTQRLSPEDLYYLWSLERVGMLYNLPTIGDKEWYRWGAQILVTNQNGNGSWPAPSERREKIDWAIPPLEYGPIFNTSFALLFLKHSHPMKDLSAKLPFTSKELNEGIAQVRRGDPFPIGKVADPKSSKEKKP
jgi:hypothetical protein